MAAIKLSTKALLLFTALLLSAPLTMAGNKPVAPIQKLQKVVDCVTTFENGIDKNLNSPPIFETPNEAVAWIRVRLPESFQEAFENAGNDLLLIAGPEQIRGLAKSRKLFYRVLLAVTYRNLSLASGSEQTHCDDDSFWLIKDTLWNYLVTNRQTIVVSDIRKLAGDDSSMESRVFVLLFTLDATRQSWNLNWMSGARAAQADLRGLVSPPNKASSPPAASGHR